MLLGNSLTLPWDLIILMLLAASACITFASFRWVKRRHPLFMKMGVGLIGTLSTMGFLLLIYGAFVEPQLITVTRISVPLATARPLKIAIISDAHLGPYKGAAYLERVVRRINALVPDIVLIAGDMVLTDEVTADLLPALRPLGDLHPSIGTFAIMGNHDHGIYRRASTQALPPDHSDLVEQELKDAGVTVLRNSSAMIRLIDSSLAIAGVEDAMSGTADILRTLSGIDAGVPTILISHNPDIILDPAALEADLIVAGHTHAGQIRLPWYGPLATLPTHLGRKFDQGLFRLKNGAQLLITRGIGESGPRVRLFAPPEIMLVTTVPTASGL